MSKLGTYFDFSLCINAKFCQFFNSLYFTSESHIHSLLTVLRYGGLVDETQDEQWKRAMDYVSRGKYHSFNKYYDVIYLNCIYSF